MEGEGAKDGGMDAEGERVAFDLDAVVKSQCSVYDGGKIRIMRRN